MGGVPAPPPGYYPLNAAPGVGATPNYAGFGGRLGGSLLDSILYGLVLLPFAGAAIGLGAAAFQDCDRTTTGGTTSIECTADQLDAGLIGAAVAVGLLGLLLVAILYLRALGKTGQTWGRKMAGVKVISRSSGMPLGFGRALGRTLFANLISGQVCYLGYLWMLWDGEKQTWHDKVVGSIVVKA